MKRDYKSKIFEEAIKMVLWDYHKKEIDEFNNITEKHNFSPEFIDGESYTEKNTC